MPSCLNWCRSQASYNVEQLDTKKPINKIQRVDPPQPPIIPPPPEENEENVVVPEEEPSPPTPPPPTPPPEEEPEEVVEEDEKPRESEATTVDGIVEIRPRPGIIPQPPQKFDLDSNQEIQKHPKDPDDNKVIKKAIQDSFLLNKIFHGAVLEDVVAAMYNREITAEEVIIKEGETGGHMYISAKGKFQVSSQEKGVLATFADVRIFGELAILYNDKRKATIRALSDGRVWVLDRNTYQKIWMKFNMEIENQKLDFLQKVPTLNKVDQRVLQKVSNLLKTEYFSPGTVVIREGDVGDKFYIISGGSVTISKEGEQETWTFKTGQFFGHLALLEAEKRQATVTADDSGVECYTLDRQQFRDHFGELGKGGFDNYRLKETTTLVETANEFADVALEDLDVVATLGKGGFGRVELVQHNQKKDLVFALKYLKKADMVQLEQQEHVRNERDLQMKCQSPFLVQLYKSYKDAKYIYFLMECCLGGDLWTYMQRDKKNFFSDKDARFYAGCVLEALTYLHERGIVYRDLKPENLLVDKEGYLKLTDFGFAKTLGKNGRTYTFAGTPEYVPPEVILHRGHDKAVDYWAFGVFIFELLTGKTPFRSNDQTYGRTYDKILRGIDNVDFPTSVGPKARHLVEKLCRAVPSERLGCQRDGVKDIKHHRWFIGFEWKKLSERRLRAPFLPKLKSNIDTKYFEKFSKDNDEPPDENSGWDKDF